MSTGDTNSDRGPIEPTWLHRGPGSGSLTYEQATASDRRPSHDGRAVTRTTFYESSDSIPPSVDRTWEELAALNDDMRHPDRATQNHDADKRRIVEIITGHLDCTDYQTKQVQYILDDAGNLREIMPTVGLDVFALAATMLVVDAETTDFENRLSARDEFEQLVDDCDTSLTQLWNIRRKLQDETCPFNDTGLGDDGGSVGSD